MLAFQRTLSLRAAPQLTHRASQHCANTFLRCARRSAAFTLLSSPAASDTTLLFSPRTCTTSAASRSAAHPTSAQREEEIVRLAELRAARDGFLNARFTAKSEELAQLEKIKAACDEAALRVPDRRMKQLFLFLIFQAAVLFDWTYVHFDWNLVEPITYLIGYSATWIAIIWYGALQREFSYDTLRGMLKDQQCQKLYAQHQFDVAHYEEVKMEVEKLKKVLRSLEPL